MKEDKKTCTKCNKEKVVSLFFKKGMGKDGIQRYRADCKDCYNSNWKFRMMSNMSSSENKKRDGRKIKGDGVNTAFLEKLKEKQKGKCYWLGIDIDFEMKDKLRKPSIDRLDNNKGYDVDNIVLTTVFANTGRRDATTNQMSEFIKTYLKKL